MEIGERVQVTVTREGLRWTVWPIYVERQEVSSSQQRRAKHHRQNRSSVKLGQQISCFSRTGHREEWSEMAHGGRRGPGHVQLCCSSIELILCSK